LSYMLVVFSYGFVSCDMFAVRAPFFSAIFRHGNLHSEIRIEDVQCAQGFNITGSRVRACLSAGYSTKSSLAVYRSLPRYIRFIEKDSHPRSTFYTLNISGRVLF